MRRRRLFVVVLIAALLIAAVAAFLTLGPEEPTIKGTSLRRWLVLVGLAQLEVDLAQIGPEAIPWLIRGLEGEQSRFDKFKVAGWRKLPRTLQLKWKNYYPIDPGTLRLQCAHSLKLFGAEATNAVPQLVRAARDTNDMARASISLQALAEMASESPQALAALLGFLKNRNYALHSQAVLALWNAELKPKEALPILLARLEECEPGSRENGAFNEMLAISRYGAEGAAAGPLLVRYLTFGEGWGNALSALKGIGPGAAPAVSRLLNMLAAPDAAENKASLAQMKPSIFRIFGNVGPAASAALPVLTNGLHDASGVVRALAAAAIANVTGDYDFAVPLLVKDLESFPEEWRHVAPRPCRRRDLEDFFRRRSNPALFNRIGHAHRAAPTSFGAANTARYGACREIRRSGDSSRDENRHENPPRSGGGTEAHPARRTDSGRSATRFYFRNRDSASPLRLTIDLSVPFAISRLSHHATTPVSRIPPRLATLCASRDVSASRQWDTQVRQ